MLSQADGSWSKSMPGDGRWPICDILDRPSIAESNKALTARRGAVASASERVRRNVPAGRR